MSKLNYLQLTGCQVNYHVTFDSTAYSKHQKICTVYTTLRPLPSEIPLYELAAIKYGEKKIMVWRLQGSFRQVTKMN